MLFCEMSSDPNVLTYFANSNLAGQVIVIVLILCSFAAWTIMIGKYLDFKRLRQANHNFERKLDQCPSVLDYEIKRSTIPYQELLRGSYEAIERCQQGSSKRIMQHVENSLQREVGQICMRYETKMLLLGSIITGAPFFGLLGTCWGVMDAFGAVALQASATIQMLAPGVSGSLLTTVAALLVAIPSVFGYNYLLAQMKLMVTELENFASQLADRIEHELCSAEMTEDASTPR
jgi:biopolymer transport protein TolQ